VRPSGLVEGVPVDDVGLGEGGVSSGGCRSRAPTQIPEVNVLRVATDLGLRTRGGQSDVALFVTCDSVGSFRAYQEHPAHRDVVDRVLLPVLESSMSIQFDTDSA
jgi:Stress responsive A/B Barrel Domain